MQNRISDNVGGVKHFSSPLLYALEEERDFALTLRLIGGLTTTEIARAFLVPEKTMGKRIFRPKRALTEAHVPFETPHGDGLRRRCSPYFPWST